MNFGTVDYSRLSNLRDNIGKAIENQAAIDAKLREQQKIDARKAREAQLNSQLDASLNTIGNNPNDYGRRNAERERYNRAVSIGRDEFKPVTMEAEPRQPELQTVFKDGKWLNVPKVAGETGTPTSEMSQTRTSVLDKDGNIRRMSDEEINSGSYTALPIATGELSQKGAKDRQATSTDAGNKQQRLSDIREWENNISKLKSERREWDSYAISKDPAERERGIKNQKDIDAEIATNAKRIEMQNEIMNKEKTPAKEIGSKIKNLPLKNSKGWTLHADKDGNQAYVSPDGKQYEEVK